jgi:hypothetical protein
MSLINTMLIQLAVPVEVGLWEQVRTSSCSRDRRWIYEPLMSLIDTMLIQRLLRWGCGSK